MNAKKLRIHNMKLSIGLFFLCLNMLVLLTSCNGPFSGVWDLPEPQQTNIIPKSGSYSFSQRGDFSVTSDSKYVKFSSDSYRYDTFEIKQGAFYYEHGQLDGKDCPTDSYAISGSFTADNQAVGLISYARDCAYTHSRLSFNAVRL